MFHNSSKGPFPYGSPTVVCEKWSSYTLRSGQTWQHLKSPGRQNSRYLALPGCCWIWCTRRTPCRRSTGRLTENQVCKGVVLLSFWSFPGTILVHCSAGVGRTGTFLAVYKLWLDYINPNVKELSVFHTVLALGSQRCLMVQKKEQYAYIAKCLRSSEKWTTFWMILFFQLHNQDRGDYNEWKTAWSDSDCN